MNTLELKLDVNDLLILMKYLYLNQSISSILLQSNMKSDCT